MLDCLKEINELERIGIIRRYAIGGAVAAIFFLEVFETEDLDVMVLLPESDGARLAPPSNIYGHLKSKGFEAEGPYILIHGVLVQFLVAYTPLVEEAVEQAQLEEYGAVSVRVIQPRYLIPILLQTNREKDRLRFCRFHEQGYLEDDAVQEVIDQHKLRERMDQWIENCLKLSTK